MKLRFAEFADLSCNQDTAWSILGTLQLLCKIGHCSVLVCKSGQHQGITTLLTVISSISGVVCIHAALYSPNLVFGQQCEYLYRLSCGIIHEWIYNVSYLYACVNTRFLYCLHSALHTALKILTANISCILTNNMSLFKFKIAFVAYNYNDMCNYTISVSSN